MTGIIMKDTHADLTAAKFCDVCDGLFYRDKRNTWKHWEKARFCSRGCTGKYNSARSKAQRLSIRESFERWVDRSGECWLWTGGIGADGYARFNYAGKQYRASRVAMELDGRPLADGLYACHHCDNPRCVRPDHLFAGTCSDNMQDMVRKGRGRKAK